MNSWEPFLHLFSVENIAVTLPGYPLSWVELVGTLFNLASVYLATRNRVGTWPVGLVGVVLFLVLFFQIRLYADVVEQIYYLFASFYGWWNWNRAVSPTDNPVPIVWSPRRSWIFSLIISAILSAAAGYLTANLHIFFPQLFPKPAEYPYVDAATTVFSFTATILMAQKRLECWVYWLIIDVIGVWLYWVKDVRVVALLYVLFLFLAAYGLRNWLREAKSSGGAGETGLLSNV